VCDAELVLLDGGAPKAGLTAHVVDGALFACVEVGMSVRGRFVLPTDWCLLAYLIHTDEQISWCHGFPMPSGACISVLPQGVAEFALSAGSRLLYTLVPMSRLPAAMPSSPLLRNTPQLLPGVRRFPAADAVYAQHLQNVMSGNFPEDSVQRLIDLHVAASAAPVVADSLATARARKSRYQVFRKAEEFMRQNLRRQIYLQELCDTAGASERSLRYAFEELAGVSPSRYLSLFRLCEACRTLSQADATRQSVKSVALSCGLWDLSRFADSYRRVFGELPRQTLQRTAGAA
jgi:AraC family ethanolamine operon transcriptional activator